MQAILFKSEDSASLAELIKLAKKLNIPTTMLTEEQIEDLGLAIAIENGSDGDYVSREEVMAELKK